MRGLIKMLLFLAVLAGLSCSGERMGVHTVVYSRASGGVDVCLASFQDESGKLMTDIFGKGEVGEVDSRSGPVSVLLKEAGPKRKIALVVGDKVYDLRCFSCDRNEVDYDVVKYSLSSSSGKLTLVLK